MDRNRFLLIGAVLAAAVVLAGGYFLGVQPQLSAADDARSQTQTVAQQNTELASATASLKTAYAKLDSLKSQVATLKSSVPSDAAAADLIREYNSLAEKTGTSIVKITNGDAQAYTPPVVAPAPAASASASSSSSASPSATPSPTPTATTPVAPVATTNSAITAANFSAIPVSVEIKGSYAQALEFMKGLHDGKRLFLVTQVASTVDSTDGDSATQAPNDWTISGLVYALTDAATAQSQQQQSTSTASDSNTATDSSSTDTAAGK